MPDDPPAVDPAPAEAAELPALVPITPELGWFAATTLAYVAVFAPQFAWMGERWLHSDYYGHGLFIPLISAYLIHRRQEVLDALAGAPDRLGLGVAAVGLLLHLAAVHVDVHFVSIFAAILVLWGLIGWLWGRRLALGVLFPIAYLGFMAPVDRLLVDGISSPLQLLSATMAAGFGSAIGMPVTRDGVVVSLPGYTFEVAVACSGLKSIITLLALGTLYAYIVRAAWWRRAVLVIATVPVALLANACRIVVLLLIARSMGANAAEGFFHSFSGVVVFGIGLGALYGVGRLLGCRALRDDI
jgi:exosortase